MHYHDARPICFSLMLDIPLCYVYILSKERPSTQLICGEEVNFFKHMRLDVWFDIKPLLVLSDIHT